eukprot:gene15299-biopygen3670
MTKIRQIHKCRVTGHKFSKSPGTFLPESCVFFWIERARDFCCIFNQPSYASAPQEGYTGSGSLMGGVRGSRAWPLKGSARVFGQRWGDQYVDATMALHPMSEQSPRSRALPGAAQQRSFPFPPQSQGVPRGMRG